MIVKGRLTALVTVAAGLQFAPPVPACAGVPRGVVISAGELIADETTGTTIARGHARIAAEKYAIDGQADTIEVRPAIRYFSKVPHGCRSARAATAPIRSHARSILRAASRWTPISLFQHPRWVPRRLLRDSA